MDTVAGVERVTNAGDGQWTGDGAWRVDPAAALEIGQLDGPEAYTFGRVSGVLAGDDGRVYVADSHALEVRIFSRGGELLGRFGRDGEGPGEFGHIGGLGHSPSGGMAALDGRLGRVSIFDAEGEFERSFRLERGYIILTGGTPVRFDARGRFYDVGSVGTSIETDSVGVVRYASDGVVEDTVLLAVYEPPRAFVYRDGVPMMSFPVPFAARPSSAVGLEGEIYATMGAEYRIARLSPEGDTVRVVRREWEAPAVTEAERDSALSSLRERFSEAAGSEPGDLPSIPERKPAILRMKVDDLGHLWVLRPSESEMEADQMEWDVFDPDGRYLGAVALPVMNVMHIGERTVAGSFRDSLDVPHVRVIPLDRGSGE